MKQLRRAGVVIESPASRVDDTLPRMDIAVFVGFAACGPPNEPQVVESAEEFTRLFGPDLPLARDPAQERTVYAYLAFAVRSFFRNGGRRCWVIRVKTPDAEGFDPRHFYDRVLAGLEGAQLLAAADYLQYQAPIPRPLCGIHAALGIEEATIIAVPDAVHRPWHHAPVVGPLPAGAPTPPYRPDWLPHPHCPPGSERSAQCPPDQAQPVHEPAAGQPDRPAYGSFLNIDVVELPKPVLTVSDGTWEVATNGSYVGAVQTFQLTWDEPNPATDGVRFVLEEATDPDFAAATTLYSGSDQSLLIVGRPHGEYYYQVRAEVGNQVSNWSDRLAVRLAASPAAVLGPVTEFNAEAFFAFQRMLLQVCAARGDLFAVLDLPEHFEAEEARAYAARLGDTGSEQERSFGALFHPWPIVQEEVNPSTLYSQPPAGVIAGVMAERTLERGAWLAPANDVLRGVMALGPHVRPDRWFDLECALINVIRQEPRGFLTLSAVTLSGPVATPEQRAGREDYRASELALIGVRRLLMLLRRLALREGAIYTFEPNNTSFQRAVKRNFERWLERMFQRGAFAGRTSADGFQVVIRATANPAQATDLGQLIVELRVAPSEPLKFLTVRLLNRGDQLLVGESTAG